MVDKVLDIIDDYTVQADKGSVNVEGLAQALGLRVNRDARLPDGISGHLKRTDDGKYEISSNSTEHEYRQRFTLAHEIGHFVLHKTLVDKRGGVDDDVKYRSTEIGDIYNSHIDLVHERQANSFAANILMPEKAVRRLIDQHPIQGQCIPLSTLYKHFKVSPSAMTWRLKNLDLEHMVDLTE